MPGTHQSQPPQLGRPSLDSNGTRGASPARSLRVFASEGGALGGPRHGAAGNKPEPNASEDAASHWRVVDGRKGGGRSYQKLLKLLDKLLDDLYLACELDCNTTATGEVVASLSDWLADFQQLAHQISLITQSHKPVAWEVRPYRHVGARSPRSADTAGHTHATSAHASGSAVAGCHAAHAAQQAQQPSQPHMQLHHATSAGLARTPHSTLNTCDSIELPHVPVLPQHVPGTSTAYRDAACHGSSAGGAAAWRTAREPHLAWHSVDAVVLGEGRAGYSPPVAGAPGSVGGGSQEAGASCTRGASGDGAAASTSAAAAGVMNGQPWHTATAKPPQRAASHTSNTSGDGRCGGPGGWAAPPASGSQPGVIHVGSSEPGGSAARRSSTSSLVGAPGAGSGSSGGGAPPGGDLVWKEKVNWQSVFRTEVRRGPPELHIPSGPSHDSSDSPMTYSPILHKLKSPSRRMVRTPQEARAAVDEKQARAERLRVALAEEKLAKLRERAESREVARIAMEGRVEAIQNRFEEKIARSEQLRQAHLAAVVYRAGDEARKVAEVAFIQKLEAEDKKLGLQQKLEDGEARRREIMEEKLARQKEAAAAAEGAAERRRLAEEVRQAELAEKARRRELAQMAWAAKLEEERRVAAAAREMAKEMQARLAQELAAAQRAQTVERSNRLEERLREAAARRLQHLELIRDRAALGAVPGPSTPYLQQQYAGTGQAGAGAGGDAGTGRLRSLSEMVAALNDRSGGGGSGSGGVPSPRSPLHSTSGVGSHSTRRIQDLLSGSVGVTPKGSGLGPHGLGPPSPSTAGPAPASAAVGSGSTAGIGGEGSAGGATLTPLASSDRSVTGGKTPHGRLKGLRKRAGRLVARMDRLRFVPAAPPAWQQIMANYDGPGPALVARWRALVAACGPHPNAEAARGAPLRQAGKQKGASGHSEFLPQEQRHSALRELMTVVSADMARPSTRSAAFAAAAPTGLLALLCAEVAGSAVAKPTPSDPVLPTLRLLLGLLQAHENVAAMLGANLAPGLVRCAMASMDRCNGSELAGSEAEDTEPQYLTLLLSVLFTLVQLEPEVDAAGPATAPSQHPCRQPAGARLSSSAGPPDKAATAGPQGTSAEAPATREQRDRQRLLMRQLLVGYMVACGLVHRASQLFSLCDQPVTRPTASSGTATAAAAASGSSAEAAPTAPSTPTGTASSTSGSSSAGAVQPIPMHVIQALHLLEAMTMPVHDVDTGDGRAVAYSSASSSTAQLLPSKYFMPPAANAASLSLVFQETSMAGLPMLLTAVLLHAAPSCTPAEARPEALPPNFVEAATRVLRVLNNMARLDLPALQAGLSASALSFCHLTAFLISYATNAWPVRVSRAMLLAALHPPSPAPAALAGAPSASTSRPAPITPASTSAAADAVGGVTAIITASPSQARGGGASRPSKGRATALSKNNSGSAGAGAGAGGAMTQAAPLDPAILSAAGIIALLNEVLLTVGYFAVLQPCNQEMLAWGKPGHTILHRLASTPLAYLVLPELSQVLLPTLAAACFRESRLCQLVEAHVSFEPVARMLQSAVAEAAGSGMAVKTGASGAGVTGSVTEAGATAVNRHAAAVSGALAVAQTWGVGAQEAGGQGRHGLRLRLPDAMLAEMAAYFHDRVVGRTRSSSAGGA